VSYDVPVLNTDWTVAILAVELAVQSCSRCAALPVDSRVNNGKPSSTRGSIYREANKKGTEKLDFEIS
jgi:hypothetical protein